MLKVIALTILLFLISFPATSGPKEELYLAAFEHYCLSQLKDTSKIDMLMGQIEGKLLSNKMASGFLHGREGKAWLVGRNKKSAKKKQVQFVVVTKGKNSCSFFAKDTNQIDFIKLFEQNLKNNLLFKENIGSQKRNAYAVRFPDLKGGVDIMAMVAIDYSKLSSIDGVVLDVVSRTMAMNVGVKASKWPK